MIGGSITLYVVAIIFVATLIRSTVGFGEALVAVPLLSLRVPVALAAPLAVLVSIVVAAVIVVQDWRRIEMRAARRLVIASLFGIPVGVLVLARIGDQTVKAALGAIIVAFSIYSLASGRIGRLVEDHSGWLTACGFVSGVLGGAYGMNGPPLVVYGTLRGWSPQQFRATLQGYFLPASIAGAIGYGSMGLWSAAVTHDFLWSLPGVAAAIAIGRSVNHRMENRGFFRVIYAGLLVTGAILFGQAITA